MHTDPEYKRNACWSLFASFNIAVVQVGWAKDILWSQISEYFSNQSQNLWEWGALYVQPCETTLSYNQLHVIFPAKTLEVYIQYVGNHMDDQIQCPHYGLFSFPYDHFAVIRWQATGPGQKLRKYLSICHSLAFLLQIRIMTVLNRKKEIFLKRDSH